MSRIRFSFTGNQTQFLHGVVVLVAALKHLDQRGDSREWISDLVGDSRGQQPKISHFFLLDHLGLRFLELTGSLVDPVLQFPLAGQ